MNPVARLLLVLLVLSLGVVIWFVREAVHSESRGQRLPRIEAEGGFPCTVLLPEGGELVISAPPQRLVLGNSSAVDMVSALIGPERIAAIPSQALRYSRLAGDPELRRKFEAVPTFGAVTAELVLSFEPDLVLVDPWAAVETVARLREVGVAVLTLPQVANIEDVLESLGTLGQVLGATDEAQALQRELRLRLEELRADAAARAGLRAMSYTNSGAGGWSAGAGTTNHELITLAGLVNASAEAGHRGHVPISFEQLYALDPDFLLVGDYRPGMEVGASARYLRAEPALAMLRAVREDRILLVPARLFSASSQEIVGGAEALAREVDRWRLERGED